MEKIIECIPNFSEGKNKKTIKEILKTIKSIPGIKLLHHTSDPSHNRTVVTFVGLPETVIKAALKATETAMKVINLEKHRGVHPRTGATDVIPLVPLHGISIKECIKYAKKLAENIGKKLHIPVYLYEKASKTGKSLPEIRKTITGATNSKFKPDFGPETIGSAGVTIVGVRNLLIAFNINLKSRNLEIARKIAGKVRSKYLRTLSFFLTHKKAAQISMNLINYRKINIHQAFKKIEKETASHDIKISESEIVGMIPKDAWEKAKKYNLKLRNFSEKQILDIGKLSLHKQKKPI